VTPGKSETTDFPGTVLIHYGNAATTGKIIADAFAPP
jgi:hypothetical protein